MLKNYFKVAWRNIRNQPFHSVQHILGLSIALTVVLLSVAYLLNELSYDKFYSNAADIYRINTTVRIGESTTQSAQSPDMAGPLWKDNFSGVKSFARIFSIDKFRVKKGGDYFTETKGVHADTSFFSLFGIPVIDKTADTLLAAPNTVVITRSIAKKYFGDGAAIGQSLSLEDLNYSKEQKGDYKVIAVIADFPSNSHFSADFFFPMSNLMYGWNHNYAGNYFTTYVLLDKKTDYRQLNEKFSEIAQAKIFPIASKQLGIQPADWTAFEKAGNKMQYTLFPMTDIHLYSAREGELGQNGSIQTVYILSILVLFMLLMACVNFINLSTARAMGRAREIGVRKVMGGSRSALIFQLLTEALLIILVALVFAFVFATVLLPYFNNLLFTALRSVDFFSPAVVGIVLLTVVVMTLLAGSYPAFYLSGLKAIPALQGQHGKKTGGNALRRSLILFQFTVSIVLIIGTITVYYQLNHLRTADIGYSKEQVLVVNNVRSLKTNNAAFKNEVLGIPGILSGSFTGSLPVNASTMEGHFSKDVTKKDEGAIPLRNWWVDDQYLATLGMHITAGENFSSTPGGNMRSVIINEEAARVLGLEDPVNARIYTNDSTPYTVRAIVKDFNYESMRQKVGPLLLSYTDGRGADIAAFRFAANADLSTIIKEISNKWKAFLPDEAIDYYFLDDAFNNVYKADQVTGKIGITMSVLAILIACVGLLGLIAYTAERRTKEIGVRKVLGASVSDIVQLLSKDFAVLVILSLVIASPLAWWLMSEWLADFAYRIDLQWWIFLAAGGVTLLITLLTVGYQAIRAALANPVKSLRTE